MAKVVTESIIITFSRLVKNDEVAAAGSIATEDDLANLSQLVDELYSDDTTRIVEVIAEDITGG